MSEVPIAKKKGANVTKNNGMIRFIKYVERLGNNLPHPMYIFLFLLVAVMVISAICAAFGVEVTYTAAARDGSLEEKTVAVINLLSREELQNFLVSVVEAYKSNNILIPMLILSFCITTVEETGFFEVALRRLLQGAPAKAATFILCLACVCLNMASDAGVILAITFGALLFKALGRNPLIGIALAYGSIQAGWGANLFPSSADVLFSGISSQLAESHGYVVHPLSNYIFLVAVTPFLAAAFTFVGEKFLAPLFGDYSGDSKISADEIKSNFELSEAENRGLKFAGRGALVFFTLTALAMLPITDFPFIIGFLRNPETGTLIPSSPFMSGLIPLIGLMFLSLGIPFGYGVGKIKNKADIPAIFQKGVVKMASLVFILFPVSLFVYQFNRSNLSTVVSVLGERMLRSINLTGYPLFLAFIIIVSLINILMYSGSAKWMILAPVFIPMFANLGVHPALTQLMARIGDSVTNGLTPLNAALVAVLALMEQYHDPELNPNKPGIGTVISAQIPIAIASFLIMTGLFTIFYFFKIPIGIGL